MSFFDFFTKLFSTDDDLNDAELNAARARHGITVDPNADKEEKKAEREAYDPWEEVRNARMNFFMGYWATRKFRIVGEDKVKAELAALDKKQRGEEDANAKKG